MKRLIIILGLLSTLASFGAFVKETKGEESIDSFGLAYCLTEKNWVMYGREGCSACNKEKEYFGEAFANIAFVDCSANPENRSLCDSKKIKAYPTWEGAPAGAQPGVVKQYRGAIPLDELAELSGCNKLSPTAEIGTTFAEPTVFYGEKKIVPELPNRKIINFDFFKEYGGIFIAGLLSFFAPCVVPLFPAYLSIITGYTFAELYGLEFSLLRGRIFKSALFFVLGFASVFTLLGAGGAFIGQLVNQYMPYLLKLSGLLMLVLGLIQLKVIKMPAWEFDYAWVTQRRNAQLGFLSSAITGVASALCWIPCIGPILATILLLSADANSVLKGLSYLFTYSMGIMFPFLLASLFFPKFFDIYRENRGILKYFSVISGMVILVFGIVLILDKYRLFIDWYFGIVKLVPETL